MSAPAFDLRPQPGEMVVSRSDVKKRRKEGNILEDPLQTSPKRTKVHAQRKFAQGSSNMSSPALTPVKDKVKVNGTVLSPELLPAKRPKTEDFLTFLCFRGTPILPPCLDFFNVATLQETPEEEQSTSVGDTSRENTRNSRLHRSSDRNNSEATGSGLSRKADKSDADGKRKPQTAVQALRRKYHEQRLAKQRASNLKKLVKKVKGKNMVRTRSAALHEEMLAKGKLKASARNAILKKTAQKVNLPQKKVKPAPKPTLKKVPLKSRKALKIRRDGLRSGGQLPPGSDVGIQSERILRQPDPVLPRLKPTAKKKIVPDKIKKTFASSLSDFSSDDDQPLAKKIKVKPKPLERVSGSRQLARKVIKRIVSKRMKPKLRMVTRSRQQHKQQQQQQQQLQQPEMTDTKENTETRVSARPSRKTKEAAALYMELLGRKLTSAEAEVDEDSLSIDSFPELPNARRNERRENEIKERAIKEKKEAALQAKDNPKANTVTKQKQTAAATVCKERPAEEKIPLKTKKSIIQKQESAKNRDKSKESESESKSDLLASKKKSEGQTIKQKRAATVPEEANSPRRSLRTPVVEPQTKKTRDATPPKLLKPSLATQDEEKFSDSDEEPLGKLALKHSNKKLGEQASTSKEESKVQNIDKKEKEQVEKKEKPSKVDKKEKGHPVEKKEKEYKSDKEKEHHGEKEHSSEKKEKESKSNKKEKDQQMGKNEKEPQVDKKEKELESNKKEKNEKEHRTEKRETKIDKKEKDSHIEGSDKDHNAEKKEKECKIDKKEKECKIDKKEKEIKIDKKEKEFKIDKKEKEIKIDKKEKETKTDKKEKESYEEKDEKSLKSEKKEKEVTERVEKEPSVTKKEERLVETKQKEKKENELSDENKEKNTAGESKQKQSFGEEGEEKHTGKKITKAEEIKTTPLEEEEEKHTVKKITKTEEIKTTPGEEKHTGKKITKAEEIKTTPRNLGRKPKEILNIKDRPILKIPVVKPFAAAKKTVLPKEKAKKFVRLTRTNKPKTVAHTIKNKTVDKTESLESSGKKKDDAEDDGMAASTSLRIKKPEVFKRHSERLLDTYKAKEEIRHSERLLDTYKAKEDNRRTSERLCELSKKPETTDVSKLGKNEEKKQPDQVANESQNKQNAEPENDTNNLKVAVQTPSSKNREANKKAVEQIADSNQTSPVSPKKKKEDIQSLDQTDDSKLSESQKEVSSSKAKCTPQNAKNEDDKKDLKLLETEKKKPSATKRKSTCDDQLGKVSGAESVLDPESKIQRTSTTSEASIDDKSLKTVAVKPPSVAQSSSEAHIESLPTQKTMGVSTTNTPRTPKPDAISNQGSKPEETTPDLRKVNHSKPSISSHTIKQPETSKSSPMKPPDAKISESSVVNQPELIPPSFRDKNKVNMSNEQIEKWIHESCLQHSTAQKRFVSAENFQDESVIGGSDKSPKGKSAVDAKSGPVMNLPTDNVKAKSPEPPKVLGIKRLQPEGAASTLQSALKKLALLEEKKNISDDLPQKPCSSTKSSPVKSLQGSISSISSPEKAHLTEESRTEETKRQDSTIIRQQQQQGEKKSIFQQRRSFPLKAKERKDLTPSANAFSPENESSVYAFETEPELPPISTPFRRKARDSRTSSTATSKSEEDLAKLEDEATPPPSVQQQASPQTPSVLPPPPPTKPVAEEPVPTTSKSTSTSSTSIAVQVNLDNEPETPTQVVLEPQIQESLPQRSMECSTQTDVAEDEEDESEGHLFYIPLQQPPSAAGSSLGTPIQGVAVKLGTEGPTGPNQRVIMRAKLVTKPPTFNRVGAPGMQDGSALGMSRSVASRPAGVMEPKTSATTTYPPVGTVQPTARGRPLGTESQYTKKPLAMVTAKPIVNSLTSRERPTHAKDTDTNCPSTSKVVASSATSTTATATVATTATATTTTVSSKRGSQKSKHQRSTESTYICTPSNTTRFPSLSSTPQMVEAPTFHPTEKEFQDPLEFIDRIRPVAEKFGLCRVVPPPNFKPECKVTDDMRFLAYNQYVHKMLHRWGPNVKEMMAIKKYLATQSISLIHPPWIGGMEVDLPRLYKIVQTLGGLKEVIEKKKWQRVADGMKIPKSAQDRVTKLDDIYCKYLLPYDTLSPVERQKLFEDVEKEWNEKEKKHNTSSSDSTDDDDADTEATDDNEECIVKGRNMPLNAFYRIARNTMSMWFRQPEPPAADVEQEFWKHVTSRQSHVCVHSGSIDSSGWGYGFPVSKNSPFARHPWNLKVLTNNSGSILRSMGPIMGVTVPTLHVGMLFTTCCWYRDPHGLPWVEYLHTGASKIWYGIPDEYSAAFRSALTKLVPRYCRNKTIWLPSDTAMVPPPMLVKHGVSLCHTVQDPGQFIIVFPKAFTSSICTGYLVSESVYFAQPSWLATAEQVFKDIRDSCEPSMFSLERLLFSIATDTRSHIEVLKQVLPMVLKIRQQELDYRKQLYALGLKTSERLPLPEANPKRKKARQAREEEGDYECEMCRANLFVSLVTNSHEEGVYCLPHAIELLIKKRHHLKYCKLMYTYDQAELNELVQKLEERIEAKSHKKSQSKHVTSSALQKP